MSPHRQWECVLRLNLRLKKMSDTRINKQDAPNQVVKGSVIGTTRVHIC